MVASLGLLVALARSVLGIICEFQGDHTDRLQTPFWTRACQARGCVCQASYARAEFGEQPDVHIQIYKHRPDRQTDSQTDRQTDRERERERERKRESKRER